MRRLPRYSWIDLGVFALAIVMLIPLLVHLVQIVIDFVRENPTLGF
jgi:hypothetical protein